jgi:hypothetical protein
MGSFASRLPMVSVHFIVKPRVPLVTLDSTATCVEAGARSLRFTLDMADTSAIGQPTAGTRLLSLIRTVLGASLLSIAFGLAILLIGLPFALLGRALHEIVAWMSGP